MPAFGRYVKAPSSFPGFSNPVNKTDNQRRSLYDALVAKGESSPDVTAYVKAPTYYWNDKDTGDTKFLPWLEENDHVPWDTVEQWKRLFDMRDQWGPSSYIVRERNTDTFGVRKISEDTHRNMRSDISRISRARVAARQMGWQLTPEQLEYLASKGK